MHFLASHQSQELQHHPGGLCPSLGLGKVLGGSVGLHGEKPGQGKVVRSISASSAGALPPHAEQC